MNPVELLKIAEQIPTQPNPWDHKRTIWELKRKGYSCRKTADFLNEHGIPVDHTTVSRILNDHPILDGLEELISLGGQLFLSEPGRPLRPWRDAIAPIIVGDPKPLLLPRGWVEYQIVLTVAPAKVWLEHLHRELHASYDPAVPYHLKSPEGFEMKFNGTDTGVLCLQANEKMIIEKVRKACKVTSLTVLKLEAIREEEKRAQQKYRRETLERYTKESGESDQDIIDEHEDWWWKKQGEIAARVRGKR